MKNEQYSCRAVELFLEGYNCAQAVYGAFAPLVGREEKEALRISSAFGGGFGRMREVCGAFSGITLVLGDLFGYSDLESDNKAKLYPIVQELGKRFAEENGALRCSELLKGKASAMGNASPRTKEFYATRPCAVIVERAANILSVYLEEEGIL